jgi:hypothetical protein
MRQAALLAAFTIAGCSTAEREAIRLIGKPVEEAKVYFGDPSEVELSHAGRFYRWRTDSCRMVLQVNEANRVIAPSLRGNPELCRHQLREKQH